jgi:sugar lactone lactonase YvrE
MMRKSFALLCALALSGPAFADDNNPLHASITTLITTPEVIEGMTNDADGNLYVPARAASGDCPVYRVPMTNPVRTIVGTIPGPCSPSGLAFGPDGRLYVTQTDRIYRFTPNATTPPTATVFATGVPGTNGLAFDWNGNLWTGDGTTGLGRVWRISADGTPTEVFRIPPMANDVVVAGSPGVGRDVRTVPPGLINAARQAQPNVVNNAPAVLGSQPLVANGLQFFNSRLYIADTARGAIWRVHVNSDGSVNPDVGCDVTFTANTLCMSHITVQHPLLEGADGFVFDRSGSAWVSVNERNAIVFVGNDKRVVEVFRNPINTTTKLRNEGPLESPTSPVLFDHKLCTANSDGNRRDNSPSTAGEIGGTGQPRGKISCLDQRVNVPGLPLPVQDR